MKKPLTFRENSRILLFAAHPDDEALATGGLLQQAAAAGAAIRVIFVTNGDNNPWPQRVDEHRWRIESADRIRWGFRRNAEALASLACLGLQPENAVFWGYPDQGITELLLKESGAILHRISSVIDDWQPTLIVGPSPLDLHPDHSALGVLISIARATMAKPSSRLQYIYYCVHYGHNGLKQQSLIHLPLLPAQKIRKLNAMECHNTQMKLSRIRFLPFASDQELFMPSTKPVECDSRHPVHLTVVDNNRSLRLSISLKNRLGGLGKAQLYIFTHHSIDGSAGYVMTLPAASGKIELRDIASGMVVAEASYHGGRRHGDIVIPLSVFPPMQRVFVKLEQRFLFFDTAGWREIPVPQQQTFSLPVPSAWHVDSVIPAEVCCLIPCYNVAYSCAEVIREALKYSRHVLAINDGSIDETGAILQSLAAEMNGRLHIVSFPVNRGKGVTLLEGFRYALENIPFDVLVTIDGDRQHRPADIPRLVHECHKNNADMVIGGRVKGRPGSIPLRSCLGNMLTYKFMRFFYPLIPHDTQSGFRAFKKSFLQEVLLSVRGGRYETELIILLLALERHKRIATVPIPTIYFGNNRSSHFQPVADALRIYQAFFSFRAQCAEHGFVES